MPAVVRSALHADIGELWCGPVALGVSRMGRSGGCTGLARLAVLPVAVGVIFLAGGTALAASTWTLQQPPAPPSMGDAELVGVSCASAHSCMAVGNGPFTDSWNGTSWTLENITGPAGVQLTGVSCASASSCEAVGGTSGKVNVPLAYRWNGTRWRAQTVPLPSGVIGGTLTAVSCVSRSSCVAVAGDAGIATATNFSETWDGTTWTPSSVPGPGIINLQSVACTAATSCFAVGNNDNNAPLAYFWSGTSWAAQTLPVGPSEPSGLFGVSCESATSCIAVGVYENNASRALIYQWDGTAWAWNPDAVLQHRSAILTAVSCGHTACTAVGEEAANHHNQVLAERWFGTTWVQLHRIVIPTGTTFSELYGVSCHTWSTCVAVGYHEGPPSYVPIAEQESRTTSPSPS
jgi:hypothetical protein